MSVAARSLPPNLDPRHCIPDPHSKRQIKRGAPRTFPLPQKEADAGHFEQPRRRATGGGGQWVHAVEIAHRPEAAQTTCSAGRRRLVMVPSAIIHQHAVEAANGCSWLQPGRGSHQDRTTSRRRQRRKCLRWPEKHRQRLWRLASVDVIELCHGLRCAFSEPSSAAAAMHQLSRYEKTDPLQTRSA